MAKEYTGDKLDEMLHAIAQQKSEAAKARSHPDRTAEKPRDVILAACKEIGARLKEDGFSFFKTGPELKRVRGDLSSIIWFQSSSNNIPGRRALVWIHGHLSSKALARWRKNHPHDWVRSDRPNAGLIGGSQIGNLRSPPVWMEWDFADPTLRPSQIEDATRAIRQLLLPFFAMHEDFAANVDFLMHHTPVSILEYTLMSLGR